MPALAAAQTYPTKPIRLLTSTAAASGADVVSRIIGGTVTEVLGKSFVVDNRAGVAGRLAPCMPTVVAAIPGFAMYGWYGVNAPAGTPQDIIAKLNSAFTQVLNQPDVQERLLSVGAEALTSMPAVFGDFLKSEIQRWTRVIRDAGIKPQ